MLFFRESNRAKLNRILGELDHIHDVEHSILDSIAASQKVILDAIAKQCGSDRTASRLTVDLGKPAEKPDQSKE